MRKIQILTAAAVFVTLTAAGCSSEQIAGVPDRSLEAGAIVTSANVDRPWKGTCDVVANFTGPTTLLITGTCRITHLGKSDVVATQTIGPPDAVTGIIPFTNTAVYTAANGDQLNTSTVGAGTGR